MDIAISASSDTDTADTSESELSFSMDQFDIESLATSLYAVTQRLHAIQKQSAALESTLSFYSRPVRASNLTTPEDVVHQHLGHVGLAGRTINGSPVFTWFLQILSSA